MAKRSVQSGEDRGSLTAFRRNSAEYLKRLRRTKRPLLLTVNGKVAAVVQDAAQGRVRDAETVLREFAARHGLRS